MSARGAPRESPWLWLTVVVAVAIGLALRLVGRIDYAEEIDAIRFIEGVESFDPAGLRPHFPGYVVFIWGARLLDCLLGHLPGVLRGGPQAALVTLTAICGGLMAWPAAALTRRMADGADGADDRAAAIVALLVAINPLLWLCSDKILSDVPALLLALIALAALARSVASGQPAPAAPGRQSLQVALAMGLLGLALGARLSLFPLAISALAWLAWLRGPLLPGLGGLAAGCLAWIVPTVAAAGPVRVFEAGNVAVSGHFFRWGGSAMTVSDPWQRLEGLVWAVSAHGMGGGWWDRPTWHWLLTAVFALVLTGGLAGAWRMGWRRLTPGLIFGLPYLGWLMLGQNVTARPRHVLPLLILILMSLSWSLSAGWRRGGWWRVACAGSVAILLIGQTVVGWQLMRVHQRQLPPPVLLAQDVERRCQAARPDRTVVYTAAMERHLRRHAPCAEVVVERRLARVRRHRGRLVGPVLALVTSDVSRLERLRRPPLSRFVRDRYVHNVRHAVELYALDLAGHGHLQ